jgi:hypothetical protein
MSIIKILLDLFPWNNHPYQKINFTAAFVLYPTPECYVQVIKESDHVGSIYLGRSKSGIKTPPEPALFTLNDYAEAVGVVSDTLPQWKKTHEFQTPSFRQYRLDGTIGDLPCTPRQPTASLTSGLHSHMRILLSPSLRAFRVFNDLGKPECLWTSGNPNLSPESLKLWIAARGKNHEITPLQISVNQILENPESLLPFTP